VRGLGEVFDAPLDTILGPHDVVEPDIIIVTSADLITRRAIEGAPALVVEILAIHGNPRQNPDETRDWSPASTLAAAGKPCDEFGAKEIRVW
jgi:hypothetical protein